MNLGVIFTNTGSFTLAVKTFCQSALKVLNMIRVQSKEKGGFTPNVMCLLYSAMVQPILKYSCEVWGVKYFHDIEKVLLNFCKEMLGLPPFRICRNPLLIFGKNSCGMITELVVEINFELI